MIRRNLFLALAALPLLAGPALASPGAELQDCLKLAETEPDTALERAAAWNAKGGGTPAKLCHALALFHRGDFPEAGQRLEDLAATVGKDDRRSGASLLGRAGWAWLRAGDNARAERLYSAALDQQPGDADLLEDRAIARAEGERFWDAIDDLNAVIAQDPKRVDAWLYRAAAHKALSNSRQALADVAQALELKPGDPEALLLRGNVKALAGDTKGARDDWKLVLRVAEDSGPGRTARANLDGLDRAEGVPKGK